MQGAEKNTRRQEIESTHVAAASIAHYVVGKVGVEAHAGRQRHRQVGPDAHQQ